MKEIEIDSLEGLKEVAEAVVESLDGRNVVAFCGSMGAGKTTLTQALNGEEIHYAKTQDIKNGNFMIDTPGEYIQERHLGGAVAISAICLKMPLILALVALVCIVDTISVMLQVVYYKVTKGKRLFKMAPFHHHLELSGYKETTVVLIFWLITLICCIIGYFIV